MSNLKKRKLRAILFADIVGYTALMQADENHASALLLHFQQQLEEKVAAHNGRIVNLYGDGALCTFQIPIDAVRCAMSLQNSFAKNPATPVRIGIHSGTVTLEGDKIFGDSVNITSRIESMGVPGGILMSKKVRDEVKNNPDLHLQSLGLFEFKNVEEPMEVFALTNEGFVIPKREELHGKLNPPASANTKSLLAMLGVVAIALLLAGFYFFSKKDAQLPLENNEEFISSIAVFPFDVKGSPDMEYLGEGMVDLISTQLDEIPKLNSIDPNEVFSQLENEKAISRKPEKAAELSQSMGATKFILGSIVQIGEDLQFSATKYDAMGREITRQSVKANKTEGMATAINTLIQKLVADELQAAGYELGNLGALTSNNLESLKFYLQGEQAYRALDYGKARERFTQATELDSTFALAWMRLFEADSWIGWNSNEYPMQKWTEYKHTMPFKWQLYHEAASLERQADRRAIPAYKSLIQQYGDTPAFHYGLAEFYFHLNEAYGRSPTEAKPYLLKTLELDPGNQEALWHLGNIAVMENDMEAMQKVLSWSNENRGGLEMLKLIIKDTVSDAEIDQVLSLTSNKAFFPILYFASEEKPFHNELVNRFVRLRPSANGKRLANVAKFCTAGREKEGFAAWKEIAKIDWNFGVFQMDQIQRCVPATLMAVKDFFPFAEHYESLYLDTKDRETPWEIYAAIKYALALNKNQEAAALKEKLKSMGTTPQTTRMVRYFNFSIRAFEAKMAGENERAMAYIDSVYQNPIGFWETQCASGDKSILAANIYAEQGEFEKAINYFNHSYVITLGGEVLMGYRNYKLSQWYEAIGDTKNALTKCNILLESYKNCDEKYRAWIRETEERKARLVAKIQ